MNDPARSDDRATLVIRSIKTVQCYAQQNALA